MLWDFYQAGDVGFGACISAAPSMHIRLDLDDRAHGAMLTDARPRSPGWGFFGVIFFGSIHLGWHYAVDGYISIISVWALWRLTGWWLDEAAGQRHSCSPAARAVATAVKAPCSYWIGTGWTA
jgi:hypothetical protein